MEHKDFLKYVDILRQKSFGLYPNPKNLHSGQNNFTYVEDDPTHVKIQNTTTQKIYDLPLVLVEFANVGVLRLTRAVESFNGSFV
jgi:hypothetical protein